MTDARAIPPCPICGLPSCTNPSDCHTQMLHRRDDDTRRVRGLSDDLSDFVLTVDEMRTKYPDTAALCARITALAEAERAERERDERRAAA